VNRAAESSKFKATSRTHERALAFPARPNTLNPTAAHLVRRRPEGSMSEASRKVQIESEPVVSRGRWFVVSRTALAAGLFFDG
jgi:hypothetical protein